MKRRKGTPQILAIWVSAALALFLAAEVSPAYAGCVAIYTDEYVRLLLNTSGHIFNARNPLPANITTTPQCEAYLHSQSIWSTDYGFRQTRCECSGSSSGGGGGSSIPLGATPGQTMALGIIGAFLNEALSPPAGPSPEEIARKQAQEAEALRIAEEENRQRAKAEADRQEKERNRRLTLAGGMQGVDGQPIRTASVSGPTAGWKGLNDDMNKAAIIDTGIITPGSGSNTAGMKRLDRMRCAKALSGAAAQYVGMGGSDAAEKARFYAEQARKALQGEQLEVECPATSAGSAVPEVSAPEQVYPGEGTIAELVEKTKTDLNSLDTVRAKKQELSERKIAVEAKKKEVEEKIAKPPEPAPGGSPDPNADALKAEAEALLRESEAQLAEIRNDEESLKKEEARLNDNLKRYRETESKLEAKQVANPQK